MKKFTIINIIRSTIYTLAVILFLGTSIPLYAFPKASYLRLEGSALSSGVPLSGNFDISVEFIGESPNNSPSWKENIDNVSFQQGVFGIDLGQSNPILPKMLDASNKLYFRIITRNKTPQESSVIEVTSTPLSILAHGARTLLSSTLKIDDTLKNVVLDGTFLFETLNNADDTDNKLQLLVVDSQNSLKKTSLTGKRGQILQVNQNETGFIFAQSSLSTLNAGNGLRKLNDNTLSLQEGTKSGQFLAWNHPENQWKLSDPYRSKENSPISIDENNQIGFISGQIDGQVLAWNQRNSMWELRLPQTSTTSPTSPNNQTNLNTRAGRGLYIYNNNEIGLLEGTKNGQFLSWDNGNKQWLLSSFESSLDKGILYKNHSFQLIEGSNNDDLLVWNHENKTWTTKNMDYSVVKNQGLTLNANRTFSLIKGSHNGEWLTWTGTGWKLSGYSIQQGGNDGDILIWDGKDWTSKTNDFLVFSKKFPDLANSQNQNIAINSDGSGFTYSKTIRAESLLGYKNLNKQNPSSILSIGEHDSSLIWFHPQNPKNLPMYFHMDRRVISNALNHVEEMNGHLPLENGALIFGSPPNNEQIPILAILQKYPTMFYRNILLSGNGSDPQKLAFFNDQKPDSPSYLSGIHGKVTLNANELTLSNPVGESASDIRRITIENTGTSNNGNGHIVINSGALSYMHSDGYAIVQAKRQVYIKTGENVTKYDPSLSSMQALDRLISSPSNNNNSIFLNQAGYAQKIPKNLPAYTHIFEHVHNNSDEKSPGLLLLSLTGKSLSSQHEFISFTNGIDNEPIGSISSHTSSINGIAQSGVKFESSGADYAEYLPKLNAYESIEAGDVVGIFDGKISKNTNGASKIMVISTMPIIIGNKKNKLMANRSEAVAFIGQVPVKVVGSVFSGDYILPSGMGDGTAIAVSGDKLRPDQIDQIIGQSWENNIALKEKKVNVAITPSASPWKMIVKQLDIDNKNLKADNERLQKTLDELFEEIAEIKRLLKK